MALAWLTLTTVHLDYKLSLRGKTGAEREEALELCHARGARRMMELCFANGGIYIKLGQHVGQMVSRQLLL